MNVVKKQYTEELFQAISLPGLLFGCTTLTRNEIPGEKMNKLDVKLQNNKNANADKEFLETVEINKNKNEKWKRLLEASDWRQGPCMSGGQNYLTR